jgi:hypothetical protein
MNRRFLKRRGHKKYNRFARDLALLSGNFQTQRKLRRAECRRNAGCCMASQLQGRFCVLFRPNDFAFWQYILLFGLYRAEYLLKDDYK